MKKRTIIECIIIIILIIVLAILIILTVNEMKNKNIGRSNDRIGNFGMAPSQEETIEKETTAEDIESGILIKDKDINLNDYSSNITITEAGDYTITGEFEYTILINAKDKVTLNLNGVSIKNNVTAAIANISTNDLIINLIDSTTNTLSDGGSSEYDACIYSLGDLTIEGKGTLNVYGNQLEGEGIATETKDITINGGVINIESEDDGINAGGDGGLITINDGKIYIKANGDGIDSNKNLVINGGYIYAIGSSVGGDAGIDTDSGFVKNGGTVIALGSDMLEKPEITSKQKSVCFNINNKISKNSIITLKDEDGEEIITFEANEDFSTLIISDSTIKNATYNLVVDGEKTKYTDTAK